MSARPPSLHASISPLKAANHPLIGSSQLFASQAVREARIARVKRHGPNAGVKEYS
ncbi:MAG: YegP family protein [Stenotrophomonas sp.]